MPKQNQKPTEAELDILAVLWERETATVREIHDILNAKKPTLYTTVLKMLQIMTEKGLAARDEANRAHVYRAVIERETTQKRFAGDLINKLFGGSAAQLMMRVLETKPADENELAQIRQMLDEAEGKNRNEHK